MKSPKHKPRKRPWLPGRVPRPFERWLDGLLTGERWKHDRTLSAPWLTQIQVMLDARRCGLIVDSARHWRESVYVHDYRKRGPTILAGAARDPKYGCTAILHEFGHHILRTENRAPKSMLREEEMTWEIATKLANEHDLPFHSHIKRQGLYSYRLRRLIMEQAGSKRRTRGRPLPRSWRLEGSKRSARVSLGGGLYSTGKRGKRHAKRFIKRSTNKAERRRPVEED